jgi:hypothetical protein
MPGRELRYAVLIGVLLMGVGITPMLGMKPQAADVQWPSDDSVYTVVGWATSSEQVERMNGYTYISRAFTGHGTMSALTIVANQNAKVFGAGAEVPFLGKGYDVSAAPSELLPPAPGREGLVATRGDERWFVVYGYGEHRGLLGNGPLGWSMAVLDGVLGRSNDYYKMFLIAPMTGTNDPHSRDSVQLADALFPRIVDWYANLPS